jgi:hypothetical protein
MGNIIANYRPLRLYRSNRRVVDALCRKHEPHDVRLRIAIASDNSEGIILKGLHGCAVERNNPVQLFDNAFKCLFKIEALIDGTNQFTHCIDFDEALADFFLRSDKVIHIGNMADQGGGLAIRFAPQHFYGKAQPGETAVFF